MNQAQRSSISRRDWLWLPGLALVTAVTILVSAEAATRMYFPEQRAVLASCFVLNDPVHGVRGKPGCRFVEKGREAGTVDYQFDDRGYRNPADWSAKNAFRIVMTGSSIALAEHVAQQASAAAILPRLVEQQTGRPVALYDEGMGFGFAHNTDLRFEDALRVSPDLILWMITPYDISGATLVNPKMDVVGWGRRSLMNKISSRLKNYFAEESVEQAASDFLGRTRMAFALRYFFYRSPSLYLKSYLSQVDSEQGFLRVDMSPAWMADMREVGRDAVEISRKARAAHIPLVIVYVPNHAQAEMVAMGEWPSGYDPYALDDKLRGMAQADGDTYLDILPEYRNVPVAEIQQDYLPVDGHPNAGGQALIARLIAGQLTRGAVPELKAKSVTGAAQ